MDTRTNRLVGIVSPLFVLVTGFALFVGTLDSPFTSDDVLITTDFPQAYDAANIARYFVHELDWIVPEELEGSGDRPARIGLYRPILTATIILDALLFGQDPFGWRLTNLALHLLASLLVLALAGRLLGSRIGALAAGLLFAAHPIHTEAVAMLLGGRAELLAGIFVIASWWVHLKGEQCSGRRRWLVDTGSALLFLLGLWSKENAVVLPAVVFLAGWVLRGQSARTLLVRLVPHFSVFVVYAVIRLVVIGRIAPADWSVAFGNAGPGGIVLSMLFIQAYYLRLVLVPHPLQFQTCYQHSLRDLEFGFLTLAGLLLVLALVGMAAWRALAGRSRGKPSLPAFALLLFYLCLLPVSHLVPHFVIMAERFLYLPSMALCLVAGWLAVRAHANRRWLPIAAGLPVLAACALGTLSRNADWADLDRLWGKTAVCAQGSSQPFDLMGTARLRAGRPREALSFFDKAAALAPDQPMPHYNRGVALQRLGRHKEAERAYRRALSRNPNHAKASLNLGTLLEARGDYAGARKHYTISAREDPAHPASYVNLGNLLQREGRYQEAEKQFRLALRIAPRFTQAGFNLARLLGRTGRPKEAERLYREILEHHPDHAMARNNLANILKDRNELEAAESHYRTALRADPDCAPAHFNLANLLMSRGDPARAVAHYERSHSLRPDHLDTLLSLGYARLHLGQVSRAREAAQKAMALAPGDPRAEKLLDSCSQK